MGLIHEYLKTYSNYYFEDVEKKRINFVSRYTRDVILGLTQEQYYFPGRKDTFCFQIKHDLSALSSMGDVYPSVFGVYVDSEHNYKMSNHLEKLFEHDYKKALSYQKQEIVSLIKAGRDKRYADIEKSSIIQQLKFKILSVYYPEVYFPVCTRTAIDGYCDAFGIVHGENDSFLDINLKLVGWSKEHLPKEWTLNKSMGFADWLWRHHKKYTYEVNPQQNERSFSIEISSANNSVGQSGDWLVGRKPRRNGIKYQKDDYILHNSFGEGLVISADNERQQTIKVKFADKTSTITISGDMENKIHLIKKDSTGSLQSAVLSAKEIGIVGSSKDGNIAIKCNYCDGGSNKNHIGFSGICSDRVIAYNIDTEKRAWCSNENCPCFQYHKGNLSKSSLIELMNNQDEIVCYESTMLSDWEAQAGLFEDGKSKRFGSTLHKGAVCVFTTRFPDMEEQDRFIFGLFLIDELFHGDDTRAGYVKCNTDYRIELTPQEAISIKFWDYYRNKNAPEIEQWGTGLYRFVSNQSIILLLQRIISIREGDSKTEAINFLKEFCRKNNLQVPDRKNDVDLSFDGNDSEQNGLVQDDELTYRNAYLITWNPTGNWDEWPGGYPSIVSQVNSGVPYVEPWRFKSSSVQPGDICYLMRLGDEPRGIVAKGIAKSYVRNEPHDDPIKAAEGKYTKRIDVEFVEMIDYRSNGIVSWETLKDLFPNQQWTPQSSGTVINTEYVKELADLWKNAYSRAFKKGSSVSKRHQIIPIGDIQKDASEELEYKAKKEFEEATSAVAPAKMVEYKPIPEKRLLLENKNTASVPQVYPRDERRKINALIRCGFTCEYCPDHKSFISKRTGKPYMETHHLIPLEYWESYENSLDVEANIVCLCSDCHNRVHYGIDGSDLIRKLYDLRKEELFKAGLEIELYELLNMYTGEYIE